MPLMVKLEKCRVTTVIESCLRSVKGMPSRVPVASS